MIRNLAAIFGLAIFGPACLSACGSESGDGVGGVSASEAAALNDAAAMLDARSVEARNDSASINPAAARALRADRGRNAPLPADNADLETP